VVPDHALRRHGRRETSNRSLPPWPISRKSKLPDGRLVAHSYELQTNKPVYFKRGPGGKGHEFTYEDDNTASNYGWKWDSELDAIETTTKRLLAGGVPPAFTRCPRQTRHGRR